MDGMMSRVIKRTKFSLSGCQRSVFFSRNKKLGDDYSHINVGYTFGVCISGGSVFVFIHSFY